MHFSHCPKNVLRSILSFVFWILSECQQTLNRTQFQNLFFQDNVRHIFWAMRKMHHTFWKKQPLYNDFAFKLYDQNLLLYFSYGCCLFCCCCKDQLPPKAKRLKSAIESIEAYRGQQLGKLQENYAQQVRIFRQIAWGPLFLLGVGGRFLGGFFRGSRGSVLRVGWKYRRTKNSTPRKLRSTSKNFQAFGLEFLVLLYIFPPYS